MRGVLWAAVATAVVALAAPERRADTDFEFDEAPEALGLRARRPRRFLYDPQNPLCRELVCKKREVCLLRDAFTAQCATKKEVLRRGDTIVAARREHGDADDDVFYETRAPDRLPGGGGGGGGGDQNEAGAEADGNADRDDAQQLDRAFDRPPERCVGCGSGGGSGSGGAQFVCGSDNRTYSSLCRLDLHNCVRRVAVRLACRGFCPCRPAGPRRGAPAPAAALAPPRLYRDRGAGAGAGAGAGGRRGAPQHRLAKGAGAEGCELDKMADRLLDWFSVLMEEAGGSPPPARGFPRDCKPEVRWMFAHLDAARDGVLARDDLYALRHDERERCLRPFLASCARVGRAAAGAGRGLTRAAWCGCLRRAARPCSALARAHPNPSPGAYVPACDARGFYLPRQCHAALGVCWCVDAHGVERPASRTKGQPACPDERYAESGDDIVASDEAGDAGTVLDAEDEAPGPADDEDAGGSGDNELRF